MIHENIIHTKTPHKFINIKDGFLMGFRGKNCVTKLRFIVDLFFILELTRIISYLLTSHMHLFIDAPASIYSCMRMYLCMHMHLFIDAPASIYGGICIYLPMHMHLFIDAPASIYSCMCMCLCMHMHLFIDPPASI